MAKKATVVNLKIVILDRGFVYIGAVTIDGDWLTIRDAKNIRYWGTTRGLGQLALEGPTSNTRLDPIGVVRVPMRALISLIDTEASLWQSKS